MSIYIPGTTYSSTLVVGYKVVRMLPFVRRLVVCIATSKAPLVLGENGTQGIYNLSTAFSTQQSDNGRSVVVYQVYPYNPFRTAVPFRGTIHSNPK